MKIEALANEFYKFAGLIKLPQKAVKELQDWITGNYAYEIVQNLNKEIETLSTQNAQIEKAHNDNEDWQRGFIGINDAIYDHKLGKLLKWTYNGGKKICYIDNDEVIYDPKRALLMLALYENEPGIFELWFQSNPTDKINISKTNFVKRKLNEEQVISLLEECHNDIMTAGAALETFVSNLNSSFESVEDLIEQKDNFQKLIDNTIIGNTTFEISIDDFPYKFDNLVPIRYNAIISKEKRLASAYYSSYNKISLNDLSNGHSIGAIVFVEKENEIDTYNYDSKSTSAAITAEHELGHLVQDAIKIFKNIKDVGGLPSKEMRTDIDAERWGKYNLHINRDIEFYTDLQTYSRKFDDFKQMFPEELHEMLAKTMMALIPMSDIADKLNGFKGFDKPYLLRKTQYYNRRLTLLKNNNPKKWKKFVSEFFKAIDL